MCIMPRITASLEERQYNHVEDVSDELDVSLAEVIRRLIDAHRRGDVDTDALEHITSQREVMHDSQQYQELADRVTELERRIDQLEPVDTETDTEATESELIEYVQSNQPVSKSDIIAACYPSDSPLNERSWWDTRAREELKDSGFEYVRNVGWQLE